MTARAYLGATALLAVGVAVAACTSSSTDAPTTVTNPSAGRPAGSWPYPNGDAENTRDAAGSRSRRPISRACSRRGHSSCPPLRYRLDLASARWRRRRSLPTGSRSASSPRWQTAASTWQAPSGPGPGRGAAGAAGLHRQGAVEGSIPSSRQRQSFRRRRRVGAPADRQRGLGDVRHRQSLSFGRTGDRPTWCAALYRQRSKSGCRGGQAALVLPRRGQ